MTILELIGLCTVIYCGLRLLIGLVNMTEEVKEQDRQNGHR
jgi:hypothetical protein